MSGFASIFIFTARWLKLSVIVIDVMICIKIIADKWAVFCKNNFSNSLKCKKVIW